MTAANLSTEAIPEITALSLMMNVGMPPRDLVMASQNLSWSQARRLILFLIEI